MKDFSEYLNEAGEVGFVTEVIGSITHVSGLPGAKPDEIVVFESGEQGQVFSLHQDFAEILTFNSIPPKVGLRAARTGRVLEVPVGEALLSNIIDPFGNPFDAHKVFAKPSETRALGAPPPGITSRLTIKRNFETGVSIVDLMIPLGKGQRELIIGDRKTGKTDFLLQTIAYAAKTGDLCIYAAIGKNKMDIKRAEEYFKQANVMKNIIMVASGSEEPAGLIYLTPYSAMTIAEYFRDKGRDVLLILDDLTTHAKFYREISLIGKRFPGRDSYPGDMFYIHARLLERAGNFKKDNGEVSITCLPVVETLQGDLSGFIQTNIMSMTDGHVYFDNNLFSQGRRPSINPFLSVTRVGRQTQSDSKRSISRELLTFLTLYDKMQNFVHFGSELTESVKVIIETGNKILQLFDQELDRVIPANVQPIILSFLWGEDLRKMEIAKLSYLRERIAEMYQKDPNYKQLVDDIVSKSNSFNEILSHVKQNMTRFGLITNTNSATNPTPAPISKQSANQSNVEKKGESN